MDGAFWKSLVFGAVLAGLGAALADLVYALVAFTAGSLLLPLLAAHASGIRIASAMLLVALGLAMLMRGLRSAETIEKPAPATRLLLPVFLLTLVNPMTLAIFAGFAPQLPLAGSAVTAAWLAFALFLGSLLAQALLAAAGAAIGAALPGACWQRALHAASAAGILAFGMAGLVQAG